MNWDELVAWRRWLRRRAENVSALLLLAMFLCFILQIVARYVFNYPLGWTDEVSVLVLDLVHACGARPSSCARRTKSASTSSTARVEREDAPRLHGHHRHRGDRAVRRSRCRRSSATCTFLKVETSAYLGIRLDYLYSIYVVFSVAVDRPLCGADLARACAAMPPDIEIGAGSAL